MALSHPTIRSSLRAAAGMKSQSPTVLADGRDVRRRGIAQGFVHSEVMQRGRPRNVKKHQNPKLLARCGDSARSTRDATLGILRGVTSASEHSQLKERSSTMATEAVQNERSSMKVVQNERTATDQKVTRQPDGPGKRIGKKGEISGIGKVAPGGAKISRK